VIRALTEMTSPTDHPRDERLRLSVPATPDHVAELRRAARLFAHLAGVAQPCDVEIAVSEAVTNAVLHAYVDAPAVGLVHLEVGIDSDHFVVIVRDDGRGLLPRSDSPGVGLGLPAMAELADRLDITDIAGGGVSVRLTFALP
jgi:anti-sigma regulatory factor (Ser/Thr protein kinase)